MSYLNMKSRRSFTFFAPYTEEGDRSVQVVFPIAVNRTVSTDNKVVHDCNPTLIAVAPTADITIAVTTNVQAGSFLIVKNTSADKKATVGGVDCAFGVTTTLMYDGNAYISVGSSTNV